MHNLISKLREISTSSNSYSALRTVLGRMYEISSKDKQKLVDFAQGLDQIAIESQHDLPEDLLFCKYIVDTYDLAYSGIYNLSDVEKDFMNSLKAHWKEQSSTNTWYAG